MEAENAFVVEVVEVVVVDGMNCYAQELVQVAFDHLEKMMCEEEALLYENWELTSNRCFV